MADRSYRTSSYVFSDFLGLAEQSDLHSIERELSYAGITLYGGYEHADRVIARFGNEEEFGYNEEFPIVCINIKPLMKKFADALSHRDFLGALMNLGIERAVVGDIKVAENEAFIFCMDNMAEYIMEKLTRVKHTSVICKMVDLEDGMIAQIIDEEPEHKQIVLSSLRTDGLISKVYNLSRNEALVLFQTQKVYVNGRLCENNASKVMVGDIINARGYGKFRIDEEPRETRKGKLSVGVSIW